jgi:AraC-like DNA-binding protein
MTKLPNALPSSQPPIRRDHLRTADVDEAARALSHVYPGVGIEPLPGRTFALDVRAVTFGSVSLMTGAWPLGARLDARVMGDRYVLALGIEGGAEFEQGGRRVSATPPRSGVVIMPERPVTVRVDAGTQARNVSIDRAALEAHVTTLTGRRPRGPIAFDPAVSLEEGPGATVAGIIDLLRVELDRPGVSPLVLAGLRDTLFTSLLAGLRHSASSLFTAAPPRVAPVCVRLAEAYIEAHAAEPITLADVAAAAGAPARSLQAAFRASRGMTPMELLRERRMDLVRRTLLHPAPETTVAGVAGALGFGSAGRFSVAYKRRFHESPSETLSRGRVAGDAR